MSRKESKEMGILERNICEIYTASHQDNPADTPFIIHCQMQYQGQLLILENLWFLFFISQIWQCKIQQLREAPAFNEDGRIPRVAETNGHHLTAKDKRNMFATKISRDMQIFIKFWHSKISVNNTVFLGVKQMEDLVRTPLEPCNRKIIITK